MSSMMRRSPRSLEMGERVLKTLAQDILRSEEQIDAHNNADQGTTTDTRNNTDPDITTEEFLKSMRNPNTVRKTISDINKFKEWLAKDNEFRDIAHIPTTELSMKLANFFMTAKKLDGQEFEPDTLKSIQMSINRYLGEKQCNVNIVEDKEFKYSRDVLMLKRKLLRQQGKGSRPNKAEPFTKEEIEIMYQKNLLGAANPKALTNTMFLNNSLYFGMRSRLEHETLRWGDVGLKTASTGEKFLEYTERATKTRTGATSDLRSFPPKMFGEKGSSRCPIAMYLIYAEKRPDKMKSVDSKFYVGINNKTNLSDGNWFLNQAIGKNTIASIVKTMAQEADIVGKKSNHSARRTGITTLIHAGIQDTLVQQHSGHNSLASINNYSSASIQQQKNMSSVLSNLHSTTNSTSISRDICTSNECKDAAVCAFPNDNDDMILVRASQEIVEDTLKEIENFENIDLLNIQEDKTSSVSNCSSSKINSVMSVPNILSGANISGNVIINYGIPQSNPVPETNIHITENKENNNIKTSVKRKTGHL